MCSGETDMNLWGSLPNHENRNIFDGAPPQGLFEARRAGFFLNCLFLIRRGGDPSGAAAIIVNGGV